MHKEIDFETGIESALVERGGYEKPTLAPTIRKPHCSQLMSWILCRKPSPRSGRD